jgi:hypothetical protein
MHPMMALWIWSVAMTRAWQGPFQASAIDPTAAKPNVPKMVNKALAASAPIILATPYLYSELADSPLPDGLLDRLADLYWVERDSELAI